VVAEAAVEDANESVCERSQGLVVGRFARTLAASALVSCGLGGGLLAAQRGLDLLCFVIEIALAPGAAQRRAQRRERQHAALGWARRAGD
jgi:hypothetical protein